MGKTDRRSGPGANEDPSTYASKLGQNEVILQHPNPFWNFGKTKD